MKHRLQTFLIVLVLAIAIAACGNSTSPGEANRDTIATASDTITSVTNPGVGSAADDTLHRP